jgi:hypothetical protein
MNTNDRQTPSGRTHLLKASSTAAAGLMIAGVAGTAAAAAYIAHQQQTASGTSTSNTNRTGGSTGNRARLGNGYRLLQNGNGVRTNNGGAGGLGGLSGSTTQVPSGGTNGS